MNFEEAISGWTGFTYNEESGLLNTTGALTHPGTLSCSGFASIVYHRLRYGNDWLAHFNFRIQTMYGDQAAIMMGFTHIGTRTYAKWKDDAPKNNLYYFNVRKESAGHVGYVHINSGDWKTSQYSRMTSGNNVLWDGYFDRYFEEWFFRSIYKDSQIELYRVFQSTPNYPIIVGIKAG